jgi:molecular chaperone IbpA
LLNKGDKKMTRTLDLAPISRFAVGFDHLFREMDKLQLNSTTNSSYPPYNIVNINDEQFFIEIAVAGFEEKDIDIVLENGVLTITGNKSDDREDRQYVHKGIAMRSFTRTFRLAEHIEVEDAKLENGLLVINLKKLIPEEFKPRKIEIKR